MLNPVKLKHTFSASQYVQASQDIIFPEKLTSRAQWIVGASHCLYRTFDLSSLPTKNTQEALAFQVKRWAPFTHSGFHAIWSQHSVGVWAWDQDKVDKNIEEVGVQAISILPESMYYPRIADTRSRWVKSEGSGEIFQLWVSGVLVVEKWFSKKPEPARMALFLRSLHLPSALTTEWDGLQQICSSVENTEHLARLPAPWGAKNKTWSLIQKLPWEHNILLLMGAVLVIAYVWTISSTILAAISLEQVKSRTNSVVDGVEEVLQARTTAENLNTQANSLLVLIDYPSQQVLMADVAKILLSFNLVLTGWDFKGTTLEVISSGRVNTLDVVRDFEQLGWVEGVSVSALNRQAQNKFVLRLEPAR